MTAQTPALAVNPLRRALRITSLLFLSSFLMLIVGIVLLVFNQGTGRAGGGLQAIGILACSWGGIGIPLCWWMRWIYRRSAKRAEQIISGAQCIARWSCSAEEWDRYILVLVQRSKKTQRLLLLIFALTAAVGGSSVVYAMMNKQDHVSGAQIAMALGLIVGMLLVLFVLIWFLAIYLPVSLLRHPASRNVYVGPGGLVAAGKYTSWETLGASIQSVRYAAADPGTLQFRWWQSAVGTSTGAPAAMEVIVSVPKSNDADARQVVEFFSNQFKKPV